LLLQSLNPQWVNLYIVVTNPKTLFCDLNFGPIPWCKFFILEYVCLMSLVEKDDSNNANMMNYGDALYLSLTL
jgi:hypothetical protein